MADLTPMMKQYFELKRQYPNCLLFFRLGDFYELFFDDAELVSKELGLVLTSRPYGEGRRAPMCGVPYRSLGTHAAQLVKRDFRVAIAEQMEDPALAKGVVDRDITRILTRGTMTEDDYLSSDSNNYIVAMTFIDRKPGLAFADVSTGEFSLCAFPEEKFGEMELMDQVRLLSPAELLSDEKTAGFYERVVHQTEKLNASVSPEVIDDDKFTLENGRKALARVFRASEIAKLADMAEGSINAAGALLDYIEDTQKSALSQFTHIKVHDVGSYMKLDRSVISGLELLSGMHGGDKKNSLFGVLDDTSTSMGARLVRSWIERPLTGMNAINARLDAVGELYDDPSLSDSLRVLLTNVKDIERLIGRASAPMVSPRDLLSLGLSLCELPKIGEMLSKCNSEMLRGIADEYPERDETADVILSAIDDDAPSNAREPDVIKPGFDSDLDSFRDAKTNGQKWLGELEARERESTGIKNLKIGYNRVFGYYIEVTRSNYDLVPVRFTRKQTLANAERFVTDELIEIERRILSAEEDIAKRESELYELIRKKIVDETARIQSEATATAKLDALLSFASVARDRNYVRPTVDGSDELIVKGGRHPIVEATVKGEPFVPNDTLLDTRDNRFLIVTGPNMAGKSTYLRQTALIALMAHMGSFVPADEAKVGLIDSVYTRIGASDDLSSGQSTFMVEMNELAGILKNATSKSLLILDEVGRGTSTFDGLSIAWAVAEHIVKLCPRTLFATHYHEMVELEGSLPGVKNYCVTVHEQGGELFFLRKIMRGGADRSFGIHVGKMAGLPKSVLDRAKTILKFLEKTDIASQTKKIMKEAKAGVDAKQIGMFADDTSSVQVLAILRDIDIEKTTPIDAMAILVDLKRRLVGGKD